MNSKESHNIKEFIVDLEEQGIALYLENDKLKYKLNKGSLSEDIKATIVEKKSRIIDALKEESGIKLDMESDKGVVPLTDVQAAYLAGRTGAVDWGNVGCQGYIEVNFHNYSETKITEAFEKLVERHEMLRSKVLATGIETVDYSEIEFATQIIDLTILDESERENRLKAIRKEFADLRYSTDQLPMFKTVITKRPEGNFFHLSVDLIIVDFASMQILISEMDRLLNNEELMPIEIKYSKVARFNDDIKHSLKGIRDRRYWMNRIDTIPMAPSLPREGRAKPEESSEQFGRKQAYISLRDWNNIQRIAADNKVTPSAVLITLYAYVCGKWSEDKKFTLNLPIQNRAEDKALSGIVGDFTGVNLLEVDLTTSRSFIDDVRLILGQLYSDLEHSSFSGVNVLRELSKKHGRDAGFMPYVFTGVLKASSINGIIDNGFSRTPQVWVDCQVVDMSELNLEDKGLMISWDIRNGAIKEEIVDDMFNAYISTLSDIAVSDNWDKKVFLNTETSCSYQELEAIASDVNQVSLIDGFLENAAKYPEKIAVIDRNGLYSYKAMIDKARNIAAYIKENVKDKKSKIIAINMKKSSDQIAAALGTIMAGFAYLPIDTKQPQLRIGKIIDSAKPDHVFDDENILAATSYDGHDFSFDKKELNKLAYIIFTSGSTGEPKGVMMDHFAAHNTIKDMCERFNLTSDERVIGIAELSFDLSVFDVFGTFDLGATLVLTDPDKRSDPSHWSEIVKKYDITLWNSVPAQAEMLVNYVDDKECITGIRNVWLSGDWIRTGLPGDLRKLMPNADIISLGGATEGGIWSIYHRISMEEEHPSVLYGKALGKQWMGVVDENLDICPDYVTGEIVIGGLSLASGYLNAKELTDKKFIYLDSIGKYIYKTGDKGRFVSGGDIEFLGRIDNQVKVNGHRIELGEIESALNELTGVKESCVVHYKDMGKERLAAFLVKEKHEPSIRKGATDAEKGLSKETIIKFNRILEEAICDSVYRGISDAIALDKQLSGGKVYTKEQIKSAVGAIEEYDSLLEKWIGILCEKNYISPVGDGYSFDRIIEGDSWEKFNTLEMLDIAPIEVSRYIKHHADNISALFRKELNPLVFLFPEGDTSIAEKLYGSTAIARYLNGLISDIVLDHAKSHGGKISILEVGGGIGATTDRVVKALKENGCGYTYLFTDLSDFFLTNSKKKYPEIETAILDMDKIDEEILGKYDVIIAAGVLNNTVNIPGTVEILNSHLVEEGLLLITEPVGQHFEINVSQEFMMPKHTDMREAGHRCFLERSEWRRILVGAGFDLTEEYPGSESPYALLDHDLFVASKREEPKEKYREYRSFLKDRITEAMIPSIIRCVDSIPVTGNGKVDRNAFIEYARSLKNISAESYEEEAASQEIDEELNINTKIADSVVEILKQISGKQTIGYRENLIEAGFDSLLLSQAAGRIVKEIPGAQNIRFDEILREALSKSTVASIAGYIESTGEKESESKEVTDKTVEDSFEYSARLVVDKESAAVIDDIEAKAKDKKILCNICDLGNMKNNILDKGDDDTYILSAGDGANKVVEIASELLTKGDTVKKIALIDPVKPKDNTFYLGDIVIACEDAEISELWKECVLGDVTECNKNEVLDILAEEIA